MGKKIVRFSGHQTFALRNGWLEKGYAFIKLNNDFSDEAAVVKLGVGKNMVDSIKYWCEMAGIVRDNKVTGFGEKLLSESLGWDPYLEDLGSWWLLHWKMMSHNDYSTSGTALFSGVRKLEFVKNDVVDAALAMVYDKHKKPSERVVMRDVDCYLRSYCKPRRRNANAFREDGFVCPLQELGLIQAMPENEVYGFAGGWKKSLPSEVIGYALSEYFMAANTKVMSIQNVLYQEGSPGQVFMLDEDSLIGAIKDLQSSQDYRGYFDYSESAGIAIIHCSVPQGKLTSLLQSYYGEEVVV